MILPHPIPPSISRIAQSQSSCASNFRVCSRKSHQRMVPLLFDLPISTNQRTTTCRPLVDEERNRGLIPETHYLRSKIPDHEDRFIECPGALGLCGFAGLQADQSLRLAGRKNQRRPASPRRHSSATSFAPSRGPRRSFRTATITISRREPVSLHFRRAHDG